MRRVDTWLSDWLSARERVHSDLSRDVAYWQERVLNVAMAVAVFLGALSLVPGVARAVSEGQWVLLVANVAVLVLAGIVLVGRDMPYRLRAGVLVGAVLGIGLVQLHVSGLNSTAALWLVVSPIAVTILFGFQSAMAVLGLVLLALLVQLALVHRGLLAPPVAADVGSPRWIETATDLVVIAAVASLFIGVLLEGLRASFNGLRRAGRELDAERDRLVRANEELRQQVARRRRAEADRARIAEAMEHATDAVVIVDPAGAITYANAAFERLFDRDRGESFGRTFPELELFRDAPEAMARVRQGVAESRTWSGLLEARRGADSWYAQASFSTLASEDHHAYQLAVIRDVSREVELEKQLRQSQKLEALGTFAGGIAHDFNNLLVPILGTAELLHTELEGDARHEIEQIASSARRARDLIGQILAFSRGGETTRGPTSLATVLEETDRLLRASLPARIQLEYRVESTASVPLGAAEAQQIILNLCTNAFRAMSEDGGRLTLRLDALDGRDAAAGAAVATGVPDADAEYVRLSVDDTGAGMDAATLGRIFEPFFTTRAAGEGTGLGLSMVHGIVQRAGGLLVVESEPGHGTRMQVLLPRATEAAAAIRPPAPSRPRGGRGETVLMVDDEGPVLRLGGKLLEKLGYAPVLLGSAAAAVEWLRSHEAPALLVTDMSMPDMDGVQLATMARGLHPDLPMILCSGLIDGPIQRRAEEAGLTRLLHKPFTSDDFARTIADALAASPRAGS